MTAIRSASSILADDQEVDPEWQARFHRNIFEDSQRLTEASQRLVSYLDAGQEDEAGVITPEDELAEWLMQAAPVLTALEEGKEPERMPDTASRGGQALVARFLETYRADARAVPLARLIFRAPTQYYKTGVVFLAWLNGFQDHFVMLNGAQSMRPLPYFSEVFRLADGCGLLRDPEIAVARMKRMLAMYGVA